MGRPSDGLHSRDVVGERVHRLARDRGLLKSKKLKAKEKPKKLKLKHSSVGGSRKAVKICPSQLHTVAIQWTAFLWMNKLWVMFLVAARVV